MEELNVKTYKVKSPFMFYCQKVIPLAFDESLSYYEVLCYLTNYIKTTITESINNNADAITELQNAYVLLQKYVDDYFNNLDVQEEINNKLDEMSESGELAEIINLYINSNAVLSFNTVADMVASDILVAGSTCKTLGKLEYNDGLGRFYKIEHIISASPDDETLINLNRDDLYARLINESYLTTISNLLSNVSTLTTKVNKLESNMNNNNQAIFTFIFDSGFNFHLEEVAPAFIQRNLQCGFALAPQEVMNNRTEEGFPRFINPFIELNKHYGFSILPLSLRHGNLTGANEPENRVQNEIWGAKDEFNIMQVNTNGWVSPYSHINDLYKKYLYIYGYAFNTYTENISSHNNYHTKNDDIYNLTRINLTFDINDIKELIDNCIDNNGFICFYGHNDITIDKITTVVDYIISKGGKIYAPDTAVANYFGVSYQGQQYGNVIENFMNQAVVTNEGTNVDWRLYMSTYMTYDADTKTINIEKSDGVTSSDDLYFYLNVPLSVFSQKDFGKQLYSKFRATHNNVTNALYDVRIEHRYMYSPSVSCNVYNKLWREPQTYDCLSYPPQNNYSGHVKVMFHILPAASYPSLSINISDIIIGILS